jgi:hypothetical protein
VRLDEHGESKRQSSIETAVFAMAILNMRSPPPLVDGELIQFDSLGVLHN